MSGDGEEYYYSDEDYEFPDGDDDGAAESPVKGAAAGRGAASAAGGAAVGGSSAAAAAVGGSGTGGGAAAPAKSTRGTLSKGSSVSTSVSGADYRLLAPDEIAAEQEKIVSEVAAVLDIPPECANTLLIHFQWSRDRLFDAYMADPKGVQKRVGIAHLGVSSYPPGPFTCDICMADNAKEAGFGLGCKCVAACSSWRAGGRQYRYQLWQAQRACAREDTAPGSLPTAHCCTMTTTRFAAACCLQALLLPDVLGGLPGRRRRGERAVVHLHEVPRDRLRRGRHIECCHGNGVDCYSGQVAPLRAAAVRQHQQGEYK